MDVSTQSLLRQISMLMLYLVELAESVEYKSLPSGLHNVEEDLM